MNDWPEVCLASVADDITVGHVGSMATEYQESGIPFLRSLNVEPFKINTNNLMFIGEEFHRRLRKSTLQPGDVVIVRTGKPGACAVVPPSLPIANCSDLVIVRPGPQIRPAYLSYVVNGAATGHINAHTVGAVQQHFNVGSARQIKFLLPSLLIQDWVISILGALDDKIDLNRRMNETLEAMARAIFKDWFVDFGPTRAKMEGWQPYLAPDLWSLFPDRLDDDGKPEGWASASFATTVEIVGGGTPKTSEAAYWNGDIPWFSVVDAPSDSDIWVIDTQKKITGKGLVESASRLLPEGSVIISARGTVGRVAMVGIPMAMNQSCYGLRGKKEARDTYTYFATRALVSELQQHAHGSVFDTITRETFNGIRVPVPADDLVEAFEARVAPLLTKVRSNIFEVRDLRTIRDLLLPKLMSGEIRVRDAEKIAEAVL